MLDLEAYLARIGLRGRPSMAELHRAHVTSIPFENLDPRRGIPVSLEPEDLERKLVTERRGGYCFEQNLLLKAGARGARRARSRRCWPGSGWAPRRARRGPAATSSCACRPRGADWHADVGFGHGTLLEPIPFGPGPAHEQSGWRFRVRRRTARSSSSRAAQDGEWLDLYGFVPEPVPFIDIETSNWFTCTHPRSPFVTGLIVSAQRPDGARVSLSDWQGLSLSEETPAGGSTRAVEPGEVGELIATQLRAAGLRWLARVSPWP